MTTPSTTDSPQFASPLSLSPAERKANLSAMHTRMAGAMARVAADPKQSKAVRAANARDARSALRAAAKPALGGGS